MFNTVLKVGWDVALALVAGGVGFGVYQDHENDPQQTINEFVTFFLIALDGLRGDAISEGRKNRNQSRRTSAASTTPRTSLTILSKPGAGMSPATASKRVKVNWNPSTTYVLGEDDGMERGGLVGVVRSRRRRGELGGVWESW